jgi:Ca2+-transporting ATPase
MSLSGDAFPNQGLLEIRDELAFLRKIRGGRLSAMKFKVQHPKEIFTKSRSSHSLPGTPNNGSQADDAPPTPSSRRRNRSRSNSAFGPATVMAGIVAGSVAGWSPIDRGNGDNDSIRFSRNGTTKQDIEAQDGIEVHPDTKSTDPILVPAESLRGPPSQNPDTTPDFIVGPMSGHSQQPSKSTGPGT